MINAFGGQKTIEKKNRAETLQQNWYYTVSPQKNMWLHFLQ